MPCMSSALAALCACIAMGVVGSVAIAAAACDCGYGTGQLNTSSNRCQCNCTTPFVLPNCIFTENESVRVNVVFGISPPSFISEQSLDTIKAGLGVNLSSSDVYYRWMAAAGDTPLVARYPGSTVAQLGVVGYLLAKFLKDIDTNATYVRSGRILVASIDAAAASPPVVFGGSLVITRNPTTITVNTIGWLIGALLLTVCLAGIEAGCFNSGLRSEEAAFEDMVRNRRKMDALFAGDHSGLAVLPGSNPLNGRPVDDFFDDPTPEEIERRKRGLDSLDVEDA